MDLTALALARIQFGVTLLYHFWFVSLTLGLSILIALIETHYVRTGAESSKMMAKFFGRFFLINYAVGVATGLVNEFQFGMNWAEYSRYVGSIFGVSLAFEALTAFFVESVAIGIWVYGWDKVSRRVHLLVMWMIAISSNYSAFWILSANSFMQHPVGHTFINGRVELNSLGALIANPYLFYQYTHTVLSGLVVAGYFIMAVSSYYLLRKIHTRDFKRAFKLGLLCAVLSTGLVNITGHLYNQYLAHVQPMKLAASEALWETANPAPFVVVAIIDEENRKNTFEIVLPSGLSVLAYNSLKVPVRGMNELQTEYAEEFGPGYYIPPVTILFWCFRIMVGIGLWLLLLAALHCWHWWKERLFCSRSLLRATLWSLPLPYIAVTTGWIMAELGRQPWLVYGMLLTERGLSKIVSAASVWTSLLSYSIVYALIALAAGYLARKAIIDGPSQ